MFSTKKLVDECAGTLAQMAEVLHKHVAQQHEFQQYQYSVNEHVFEAQKALTGYVNSLADELVGLREEVNIIRVEYARLIQLVKEYRNGEEAG